MSAERLLVHEPVTLTPVPRDVSETFESWEYDDPQQVLPYPLLRPRISYLTNAEYEALVAKVKMLFVRSSFFRKAGEKRSYLRIIK